MYETQAKLALVGEAFWEEQSVRQAQEAGMLLVRLDEAHVSPYQPADMLIKNIFQIASSHELYIPGALQRVYEKEIVGICSPHSYDLQTGFGYVYSLIRAEEKRTLYLDFTYYNSFFADGKNDVGDLFYEMQKQYLSSNAIAATSMEAILAGIVEHFGALDYVMPVRVQMDLEDLEQSDIEELLHRILRETGYELVVLNLPVRPSFLQAVYTCCSRMYSLQKEGSLYDKSQELLVADLKRMCEAENVDRLQIIRMPPIGGSFSLDISMYEELLFGEMGTFIRRLLKEKEGTTTGLCRENQTGCADEDGCVKRYN